MAIPNDSLALAFEEVEPNVADVALRDPSMVEIALLQQNTQHSVALAFKERYDGYLLFDHNSNNWLEWTGQYWAVEKLGRVMHYCRELSAMVGEKASQRRAFVEGVERFCRDEPIFASNSNLFDLDRYAFNCPDGTYNLLTGAREDHSQKDLITNIAGCSPKDTYGKRFPVFLEQITCGDKELENFLQVALGACLSGALENNWLMFWIGDGRNGKNTLGDAVMRVMGTYARKIPSSALMKSKHEGHPTEIANLKGCRLAVASEVEQSSFFSESRINELTGDAMLSARFMRGNFFEFERTFKFLIYGNHRPRLNSVTDALRERIKMVRFSASFTGRDGNPPPDPDLAETLRKEDGNILRWLIEGHIAWIKNGKKLPQSTAVDKEIQEYISSQSTVDNWINECLDAETIRECFDKASYLYKHYKVWKEDRNEHPLSLVLWADVMVKRFERQERNNGNYYSARLKAHERPRVIT